ncbi:hypothetical protein HK405_009674 [Cladochytrium tenue]|nr:hypothetical protein HK405_009674 [Cladochytrium tenue]
MPHYRRPSTSAAAGLLLHVLVLVLVLTAYPAIAPNPYRQYRAQRLNSRLETVLRDCGANAAHCATRATSNIYANTPEYRSGVCDHNMQLCRNHATQTATVDGKMTHTNYNRARTGLIYIAKHHTRTEKRNAATHKRNLEKEVPEGGFYFEG